MKTIKLARSVSNSLPVYLSVGPVSDRLARAVAAIESLGGAVRVERDDVYVDLPDSAKTIFVDGQSPRFRRTGAYAPRFADVVDVADDGETACVTPIGNPERNYGRAIVLRSEIGSEHTLSRTVLIPCGT